MDIDLDEYDFIGLAGAILVLVWPIHNVVLSFANPQLVSWCDCWIYFVGCGLISYYSLAFSMLPILAYSGGFLVTTSLSVIVKLIVKPKKPLVHQLVYPNISLTISGSDEGSFRYSVASDFNYEDTMFSDGLDPSVEESCIVISPVYSDYSVFSEDYT